MAKKTRLNLRDVLTDGRIALMLPLGFSAGLPLLLVFGTLSAWLATLGISATTVGLVSFVTLTYTLKFLWAPFIDRVDIPLLHRWLGRRRAWMAVSQIVVALGLVLLAMSDPAADLYTTVVFALVVAFASATQDVVIDGWRIDASPIERQGLMSAAYQLGYRVGMICAGAGALYIAALWSWSSAYVVMAVLMSIGLLATLFAPRVELTSARGKLSFAASVSEPLVELFRTKGWLLLPILALIGLFSVPDRVAGVMANKFYVSLGFSLIEIANVSKLYGVWIGLAGAFAGGIAISRIGLWPTLLIGVISTASSNLMFTWLAYSGPQITLLTAAISVDNFAAGFAGSAAITYMSGLTSPGFAATQYALLSSLNALPGKLVGGLSGAIVDSYGYPALFTGTAFVGLPLIVLCFIVRRDTIAAETGSGAVDLKAVPAQAAPP